MEIWNNPACSKCAAARETLDAAHVPYTLRPYLEQPPTEAELREVLAKLGMEPWEICRLGEPAAKELGLADWGHEAPERWISVMTAHPELIQRPILILDNGRALVGRTATALAEAVSEAGD
ncbi:ArsC/Spx/MgsR family protein [Longispora albida]|uniref:ArsC/Spx/MgsR family protein n=1 Tax=Longispora albida TaxID=203523 RepID=UPI00037B08AC|nr:ArsC/Spx/MgsR family protein [Longispora albida]